MVPRLKTFYKENVIPKLMDTFKYKSIMEVPKISKIVLNMGVGEGARDKKAIQFAVEDMRKISGQQPVITIARKSIAGFKIRDGMAIGCKVTLRQTRMYEFLDRLISIAIPRIRDFQGLSPKKFDGFGNYNMGVKEQIIFPEISYDAVDKIRGLDICIVTTAKTNDEAKILLRLFDFPLIGVGVS